MTDKQIIIGMTACLCFLAVLFIFQSLILYVKSTRCRRLKEENKLLKQFFEQRCCMDAEYLNICRAMVREATHADTQTQR